MSVSIAFAKSKPGLEDDQPAAIKPEAVTLQKININLASGAELKPGLDGDWTVISWNR